MSSSGLIYAVIVGAWAAYLVPMWLRRQDELNEARPTERFSTAIRLLSGRAGMERRYARDLQVRSDAAGESGGDPDKVTDSVDVRALAVPTRTQPRPAAGGSAGSGPAGEAGAQERSGREVAARPRGRFAPGRGARTPSVPPAQQAAGTPASAAAPGRRATAAHQVPGQGVSARYEPGQDPGARRAAAGRPDGRPEARPGEREGVKGRLAGRGSAAAEAAARAQRSKVLARRRRTTVMLFIAFSLGAVIAAVGGIAFLWVPGVPAVLLSAYIVYLRRQERRRFTYTMDRRRAEAAAQRLRERQSHRRPGQAAPGSAKHGDAGAPEDPDDAGPGGGPQSSALSALAADRRALVEQTDHAEWVDQQRERRRSPAPGESWDPVPVPLPTYVTAPVAPRAGGDIDRGDADAWSATRSSPAEPSGEARTEQPGGRRASTPARPEADEADADPAAGSPDVSGEPGSSGRGAGRRRSSGGAQGDASDAPRSRGVRGRGRNGRGGKGGSGRSAPPERSSEALAESDEPDDAGGGRSDARRAASARRSRERGRTPLFDQYAEGERPRAANQ